MGNILSAWIQELRALRKDMRLVMVGLDGAGKTTILYKLKIGELVHTIPTIGFNVETVKFHNVNLTIWDIGGQDKIRPLWRHYYCNANGIIFVVDASDRDRISEAREELSVLLKSEDLWNAAVLVFANKQDLPAALTAAEITEKLGLHDVRGQPWYVQGACAPTADGLDEGLRWLTKELKKRC